MATALLTLSEDLSSLTIELTNTIGQIAAISQILTNFEFDAISGVSFSLTGATAAGTATCTAPVAGNYTCSNSLGTISELDSDPFGWTAVTGTDVVLAAGNGSFKPYGIVNTSIANCTGANDCDGLANSQHIPHLLGPVEFSFSVTGLTAAPEDFTNVRFSFGTGPDYVPGTSSGGGGGSTGNGQIPEPSSTSLALLGVGLLAASIWKRRRSTQS